MSDLINYIDELVLLQERLHKVLRIVELAGVEIRFLCRLAGLLERLQLVRVEQTLACHPLDELRVVDLTFTLNDTVVQEALLCRLKRQLIDVNLVPDAPAAFLYESANLFLIIHKVKHLEDTFDEFVELVETERHRVVHVKEIEGCEDLVVDAAAAQNGEAVGDFFCVQGARFVVVKDCKHFAEGILDDLLLSSRATEVVLLHHVKHELGEALLVQICRLMICNISLECLASS